MAAGFRLPPLDWLPAYRKDWLRPDLVAGLTTAAVVIPKAMAYATIAGLPVQVGLYTAFVPLLVYALLGTSRPLSATTTTTLAILTGTALGSAVPGGDAVALAQAAALLALMAGAILIAASVLRLGFIAHFISEPVLVGFKAGIGVVIIVDQIPKILGIHFDKGSFLQNLKGILTGIPEASIPTVVAGVLTIVALAVIEKWKPRWPAPLIVIGLAILAVATLGLEAKGIALIGTIPSGVPAFQVPALALAQQLWPAALGIALMSFTETAAVGRAFARSDEPAPQANAELFATGAANVVGAFFGSMPSGGGMSQTAVNRMTGARTQIASLTTAATTLLTMLLLAPLLALMPHAVLAGTVIFYSIGLIHPSEFRDILAIRRTEFLWAVAAFAGVMLIGTLQGILVAIVVSLVALVRQSTNPTVYLLARKPGTNIFRPRTPEHPEDQPVPGLLLIRLEGRAFFLNAERFGEQIRALIAASDAKVVVLDLGGVFDLEYSALKMLTEAEQRQRDAGVSVWLVGLGPSVDASIRRSRLGKNLCSERLLFNVEAAVEKFDAMQRAARPESTNAAGGSHE